METNSFHRCLIAGTHSSVGKTTWMLALMALARRKGLAVQPFKGGPDYIDPGFHHEICAPRKSRNLDLFLLSGDQVSESFKKNSEGADFAFVEGMMGLFDGKGVLGGERSSAQIAKLLDLPVLLVIDGSAMAASGAAVALGFQQYDPEISIGGILLNRVNSERHFHLLKEAIESRTGIPCLGYLPKNKAYHVPERHLGLTTAAEMHGQTGKFEEMAGFLETHFDWDRFLKATEGEREFRVLREPKTWKPACRIGVACDTAFSFYYEDNLDLLRQAGAELVFFSPLHDAQVPAAVQVLYFGGGFPEVYAAALAANTAMKASVRRFYDDGGAIYAECGGLIYLTEAFLDRGTGRHEMAGILPGHTVMNDRLQHFGYHEIETAGESFFGPAGLRLRSHEFHYSSWDAGSQIQPLYRVGDRTEGAVMDRLAASYQHLHFGSAPEVVEGMIAFGRTVGAVSGG